MRRIVVGMIAVGILLAGCGGLAGEPQIVATIAPPTPEANFPSTPPDLALGAQVYAAHCTQCHGIGGQGDGTLIGDGENQIPNHPADFTVSATTANQTLFDWYKTITNGRIENLMPPWSDSLSLPERWAVASYTYMLHYGADAASRGEALVAGAGVSIPALSQQVLANTTDADLLNQVAANAAFINTLDEAQRNDVAAYLRARGMTNANAAVQSPLATEEPLQTEEANGILGTVSGQVKNGSIGGAVPADLSITLNMLDAQGNNQTQTTTLGADGTFTLSNVPIQQDLTYIVTVTYLEHAFASEALQGNESQPTLDLPVTIYDFMGDTNNLRVAGMAIQVEEGENTLQIAQVLIFTNISDKAFSTDQKIDDGRFVSVEIPLPPGAQVLSVSQNDSRYALNANGTVVFDTTPVLPGEEHVIQVIYSLPYNGDLQIGMPLAYTVSGPVRLLIPSDGPQIVSNQLKSLGPQALRGVTYQSYGTDSALAAGDTLIYSVRGGNSVTAPDNSLSMILIALGIVVVIGAGVLYLYGRRNTGATASGGDQQLLIDGLVREIAELDAVYSNNQLDEATYQKRRTKLKSRLAEIMDKE